MLLDATPLVDAVLLDFTLPDGDGLALIGTDGRRLAHAPTPHTVLPESLTLPTRFIQPLAFATAYGSPSTDHRLPIWLNGTGATDGLGKHEPPSS